MGYHKLRDCAYLTCANFYKTSFTFDVSRFHEDQLSSNLSRVENLFLFCSCYHPNKMEKQYSSENINLSAYSLKNHILHAINSLKITGLLYMFHITN